MTVGVSLWVRVGNGSRFRGDNRATTFWYRQSSSSKTGFVVAGKDAGWEEQEGRERLLLVGITKDEVVERFGTDDIISIASNATMATRDGAKLKIPVPWIEKSKV